MTLVLGDEELLVARAVSSVVTAVRAEDADADVRDLTGADVAVRDLLDLLSPSLFGGRRVVVVRSAQELGKDVAGELQRYTEDPLAEICLVVAHTGGAKGKALVDALRAARAAVVECPKVKWASEREEFVRREVHSAGGTITDGAVRALLDAVGNDLRELATAAGQLVADTGAGIDEEVVARYYRGKADATGFLIADRAVDGDVAGALEVLRWGLAVGLAPVLVTSALAGNLRAIAKVANAGRAPTGVLVKQLAMPGWKIERAQRQARAWRPEGIATALRAVVTADGAVKGAGADAAYALERAVLSVTAARGR